HASPGDKTMLDALHPVVVSLRESEDAGRAVAEALDAAVSAAQIGSATTADMVARIGRASRLGERSRGLPDAGATSFTIIVRAMVEAHRQAQRGTGEA
ncbi:MAG TPA: DAK2 domain-containing protein, partial [Candidatus Limnocylindrales bacterium]|nr:DAK2 domain-containing protein [Candidatus Limnocylindrales bacterium]